MIVLVCYDVETTTKEGRRRLRKVAKTCENYGQRAQKSVFECKVDKALYLKFENALLKIIDKEKDSLRFYYLDEDAFKKVKTFGKNTVIDFEKDSLVF